MKKVFILRPGELTLNDCWQIIKQKKRCQLDPAAIANIHASQAVVNQVIARKQTVYGVNTGFGLLAHQAIDREELDQLQRNIVLSHACGTGELLNDETVALILLLKINSLAQGYSGVRLELIEALLALYNQGVYPCIPAKGSVGASGDLVPLAHMALPLIGEGEVRYRGKLLPAQEALARAKIGLIQLAPKEGLALLNGLQVSAALAIQALYTTEILFETAIITGALSTDAACGSDVPFDERIHQVRGHEAQQRVAMMYKALLKDSPVRESHRDGARVQDPYCLRCQPQVMGAILHQIQFVRDTLSVEVNTVTDNPLVFVKENTILSGGNFHGEMIAMAADNLALAIAEMGALSERRIALLIDAHFSGLPAFLVHNGGLHSGFMIAHVTAAACASDNKALAHPHCVDSLPTSANQEDHVSMATNAGRRLHAMLDNTATILTIELLAACQGLDFHRPKTTSPQLLPIYEYVRKWVATYDTDRYFAPDIAIMKEKILHGRVESGLYCARA